MDEWRLKDNYWKLEVEVEIMEIYYWRLPRIELHVILENGAGLKSMMVVQG